MTKREKAELIIAERSEIIKNRQKRRIYEKKRREKFKLVKKILQQNPGACQKLLDQGLVDLRSESSLEQNIDVILNQFSNNFTAL